MRKLIFVADGQISNCSNSKYDKYIGFTNEIGDERFAVEGKYYIHEDFAEYIKKQSHKALFLILIRRMSSTIS